MRDYAELLSAYFDESLTPAEALQSVSYTHLTLPTILLV